MVDRVNIKNVNSLLEQSKKTFENILAELKANPGNEVVKEKFWNEYKKFEQLTTLIKTMQLSPEMDKIREILKEKGK